MKRILGLLVACCLWIGMSGQGVEKLLAVKGLRHAAVGVCVKRVKDGQPVVEYQAHMALAPASVVKLLPTWLALRQKGKDYRYRTKVYYTDEIREGVLSGDIVIQAGGDPCLESGYFPAYRLMQPLAEKIAQAGIREIRGKVKVEGAKEGKDIPGGWLWEDVSNYYAALYLPFNYRDNTFTLTFATQGVGTPARLLGVSPVLPGVQVVSEVVASAEPGDHAWIYGGPYSRLLCVKGTLPAHCSSFRVKGALSDPAAVFVKEMEEELKKKHIRVEGETVAESKRTELMVFYSPRLEEIIRWTNKKSVNLFAEALGHLAGEGKWTEKAGELLRQEGVDFSGSVLRDACGLSPWNAVPAEVFTDLLICAARKPQIPFRSSLPTAGKDKGLNGYLRYAPTLKNRLEAKTGSMTGVRALSGYLTLTSGEAVAFTILVNHYTCSVSELQQAVAQFLMSL